MKGLEERLASSNTNKQEEHLCIKGRAYKLQHYFSKVTTDLGLSSLQRKHYQRVTKKGLVRRGSENVGNTPGLPNTAPLCSDKSFTLLSERHLFRKRDLPVDSEAARPPKNTSPRKGGKQGYLLELVYALARLADDGEDSGERIQQVDGGVSLQTNMQTYVTAAALAWDVKQ
jgi:hypothetical protein